MRISRDEIFIKTALLFAERGKCLRAKVGCVITRNNRIVSTGYVGSPPGEPHCLDEGCIIDLDTGGCIRTIHAEENAINFLPKKRLKGYYVCYCTLEPCENCSKMIIDYKIDKVVYLKSYRKHEGLNLLKKNNIIVEQYRGRVL